jgi:hypothetical protein
MPFVSKAQSRFMHSQHPEIAKRWDKLTKNPSSLPEHKKRRLARLRHKFKVRGKKPGDLLHGYKTIVDNKLKNYGETDDRTKTIRVNKKLSKRDPSHKRPLKGSKYPEVLDTELHESLHAQNPKLTEKQVYKKTHKKIRQLTRKQKQKLYAKFK